MLTFEEPNISTLMQSTVFGDGVPNEGLTPPITREEVEVALKGMKHGKAMGPDGIPVEVWKSLGEEGVDMLLDLLQKIFEQEKMPEEWRDSVIVPTFKEKGDIQDCGNYRGINMIILSHTMNIWESIIDRRLREETSIGEEQFGFMPSCMMLSFRLQSYNGRPCCASRLRGNSDMFFW